MSKRYELEKELFQLSEILNVIPEDNALDRWGLERRIQEINEELTGLEILCEPVKLAIMYEGTPVIGSRAVDANFINKALGDFLELIKSFKASAFGETGERGPLSGGKGNPLYMTGIALGSFGFEFEQYNENQLPIDVPSEIEGIIARIEGTFKALRDSEEDAATEISGLDKRVVDDIRALVSTLGSNEATMSIRLSNREFRLSDNDIATLSELMKEENISEDINTLTGVLYGVLPDTRKFEFLLDNNEIIAGKIDRSIEKPEDLNLHILQRVIASIKTVKVGKARPRYILQGVRAVDEQLKF